MLKLDSLLHNKLAQNILVWSCIAFLVSVVVKNGGDNIDITEQILTLILFAVAVYINNFLILPYFYTKRVFFFLFFFLNTGILALVTIFLILDEPTKAQFFNYFVNFIFAVSFGISLKIARDGFALKQQEKEAELKLLKAQLNPHFLFNTLNNLYGLSVVKSNKLPDLMLQLSDLLRYSLYETKEVLVSLEKEVDYLQNYISLEKIRLEEKTTINILVKGEIVGKQIPPMLLIVFVENAFKHLGEEKDKKGCVDISLEVIGNTLCFKCKNSSNTIKIIEEDIEKGKSGIGLANAKKRLALLYPEAHKLSIIEDEYFFNVDLTLGL